MSQSNDYKDSVFKRLVEANDYKDSVFKRLVEAEAEEERKYREEIKPLEESCSYYLETVSHRWGAKRGEMQPNEQLIVRLHAYGKLLDATTLSFYKKAELRKLITALEKLEDWLPE
jgi:hypothetical protein